MRRTSMIAVVRRLVVALVTVVAAVGSGVWLAHDGRRLVAGQARAAAERAIFGDRDAAAVADVSLALPSATFRATRDDAGHWQLTAPIAVPAEDTAIAAIVSATAALRAQTTFTPDPADLGIYGLAPPLQRLTLGRGTDALQLAIGRQSPFDGSVYVQVVGQPEVHQVAASLAALLDKDLFRLRDKRAVAMAPRGITHLDVAVAGEAGYQLAAGPDGNLALVAPIAAPADRDHVEMVLGALEGMRAQAFVREDAPDRAARAPFGLDRPVLAVTLHGSVAAPGAPVPAPGSDGNAVTLLFGQIQGALRTPRTFVMRAGPAPTPVLALDQDWALSRLRAPLTAIRDLRLLPVQAAAVAELTVTGPGDGPALHVRRTAPGSARASHADVRRPEDVRSGAARRWAAADPDGPAVDAAAVTALVAQLVGLRGEHVEVEDPDASALTAHGLLPPRLTVCLRGADGEALGSLRVGARRGEATFVAPGDGSRIDRIATAALSRLSADPADFASPPSGAQAAR